MNCQMAAWDITKEDEQYIYKRNRKVTKYNDNIKILEIILILYIDCCINNL
jgi:hypothetical protein